MDGTFFNNLSTIVSSILFFPKDLIINGVAISVGLWVFVAGTYDVAAIRPTFMAEAVCAAAGAGLMGTAIVALLWLKHTAPHQQIIKISLSN